jgi:hypothetical protein
MVLASERLDEFGVHDDSWWKKKGTSGESNSVVGARVEQRTLHGEGAVSRARKRRGSTLAERIRQSQRARMTNPEWAGIRCIWVVIFNIGTSSVLVAFNAY